MTRCDHFSPFKSSFRVIERDVSIVKSELNVHVYVISAVTKQNCVLQKYLMLRELINTLL